MNRRNLAIHFTKTYLKLDKLICYF